MIRPLAIAIAVASFWLPFLTWAKGSDGIVVLHGRIEEASASEHAVTFLFTGDFSFTMWTGPPFGAESRKVEQQFKVSRLPVRVPQWMSDPVPGVEGPYVVNFENATRHAIHASRTGEAATIVLFRPIISYDQRGVMTLLGCTHAQVLPDGGPPGAR